MTDKKYTVSEDDLIESAAQNVDALLERDTKRPIEEVLALIVERVNEIRGCDDDKVPTIIYLWSNGMVMTFNKAGKQIPEYQGPYEETIKKIPSEYHHLINQNGTITPVWRVSNE